MIGYFIQAGDVNVDEKFSPYVWPYRNIIHQNIKGKDYGIGLKLIVIEYILEGKFIAFPEKRIYLTPVRKKEQALSVRIGVTKAFGNWNDLDKKKFIVNTTNEALQLVRDSLLKKGYADFNFAQLLSDLAQCATQYLDQS